MNGLLAAERLRQSAAPTEVGKVTVSGTHGGGLPERPDNIAVGDRFVDGHIDEYLSTLSRVSKSGVSGDLVTGMPSFKVTISKGYVGHYRIFIHGSAREYRGPLASYDRELIQRILDTNDPFVVGGSHVDGWERIEIDKDSGFIEPETLHLATFKNGRDTSLSYYMIALIEFRR